MTALLRRSLFFLALRDGIARDINAERPIEEIVGHALRQISDAYPDYRLTYATIDEGGTLRAMRSLAPPHMPDITGLVANLNEAKQYLAQLRSCEPVMVADTEKEPMFATFAPWFAEHKTRALLDLPLINEGRLLGLLCFDASEPHQWTDDELAVLMDLSESLALALRSASVREERARAVSALRMTTLRLSTLIQSLHAGILVEDESRRIVLVNDALCELLRLPVAPAAMIGLDCQLAFERGANLFADPERVLRDAAAAIAGRAPVYDYELRLADGRVLERDYIPISLENANHGHLWSVRDVTQRKAVERMKDEFVSTVSHELRTPLTVIFGALRLLRGGVAGDLAPLADQLLRTAEDNAGRLVRMISDILDLSNAAAGRLSGVPEVTEALTLLETARAQWQELARQQEVRLRIEPSEAVALCDPRRIVQALSHLISNALKHSPAGGEVRLSAEPRAGVVRFSVRDEGPGIAPEDVAKLFQRFRQLDSSDSRPFGGTGLGLALARVIVAEHGGVIGVDSQPGRGATFWFELRAAEPLNATSRTGPTNPTEPAPPPAPEPTGDR